MGIAARVGGEKQMQCWESGGGDGVRYGERWS